MEVDKVCNSWLLFNTMRSNNTISVILVIDGIQTSPTFKEIQIFIQTSNQKKTQAKERDREHCPKYTNILAMFHCSDSARGLLQLQQLLDPAS